VIKGTALTTNTLTKGMDRRLVTNVLSILLYGPDLRVGSISHFRLQALVTAWFWLRGF
jgi:hypothetical protein